MYLSQDASLGGCVTSKGGVAISSHPNGAAAAEGRNRSWPSKCMPAIRLMYQKAVLCLRNSAAQWIGQLVRKRRVKAINLNYGRRAVSTVAPWSTTPLQGCIKSRAGCHRAYQRATDGCTRRPIARLRHGCSPKCSKGSGSRSCGKRLQTAAGCQSGLHLSQGVRSAEGDPGAASVWRNGGRVSVVSAGRSHPPGS